MAKEPARRVEITPKTMLMAALIAAGGWLLIQLFPVLVVCTVSLFLVGTLNPAVAWLERRRVKRGFAIAFVFGGVLAVSALIGLVTVPSIIAQGRSLIEHEPEIRNHLADLLARSRVTEQLAEGLRNLHYEALAKVAGHAALMISTRAAALIGYLVSILFLALYIMVDRYRLRGGLYALVPRRYHMRLSRVLLNLETIVGGYIRGQVLTSLLIGGFAFVLLTVCRVPSPLPLAVFAGVTDVLPYIGGAIAIAPSAAAAAASRGVGTTIAVVIAFVAYQEIESRVLVPRIYGRALRLPSSLVMVALLTGGALAGIIGALLALPLAAAIRMFIEELRVVLPGDYVDNQAQRTRDERAEAEYLERAEHMPASQAAAIAAEMAERRRRREDVERIERAAERRKGR